MFLFKFAIRFNMFILSHAVSQPLSIPLLLRSLTPQDKALSYSYFACVGTSRSVKSVTSIFNLGRVKQK